MCELSALTGGDAERCRRGKRGEPKIRESKKGEQLTEEEGVTWDPRLL